MHLHSTTFDELKSAVLTKDKPIETVIRAYSRLRWLLVAWEDVYSGPRDSRIGGLSGCIAPEAIGLLVADLDGCHVNRTAGR